MSESAQPTLAEHPLVTDGMRRVLGIWDEWSRWSDPICDSDIRRWAVAVYWPESPPRRYWDPAERTGGLIAPDEFNPFAWPAPSPSPHRSSSSADRRPDPSRVRGRVNGGCQVTYGAPMRPGDRIRRRVRLEGWRVTDSSRGTLLLVDYEHEWRNDRDELVRLAVYTLIHW
jgi:hypothetical protein